MRLAAAAVTAVVMVAGCGFGGGDDRVAADVPAATPVTATPPAEEPVEVEETPEPEPTRVRPSPTRKKNVKPRPVTPSPSRDWRYQEPPCSLTKGKRVSNSAVRAALENAAARTYWRSEAPHLKLSYPLGKAVAFHESGWQSNIYNCDGGMGLMQVMPDTVAMLNGRFGLEYTGREYRDNAYAGANYLAWLTRYFGDRYFGKKYDLSAKRCSSIRSWCLLNLVIAGYNTGHGAVVEAEHSRVVPKLEYVEPVRALMTDCPCDRY